MSTLKLTLKRKWFDLIASGEKTEEYREFKKYWVGRLSNGFKGALGGDFMNAHKCEAHVFRKFEAIEFRNGYARNAPRMTVECLGISIGKARPEWSDNYQGEVFVLKLGKILSVDNLK